MRIIISILLSAAFLFAPGASSFADSVTRSAVLSRSVEASGGGALKTGQVAIYATYDDAWYVTNGDIGLPKTGTSRYTDNGDTITDNVTKLEWVKNLLGAGIGGIHQWAVAITACENLSYAGHSDWRLPNVNELMSIVDYGRYHSAIDPLFTACADNGYWSSTALASNTTYKWRVFFDIGSVSVDYKTMAYNVRPVRDS